MKKTLYQILGVDPKATQTEIEAAYSARIDELKFATLQDPNKLRVLQTSKDILSDPNQRATYDASITQGGAPEPAPERQVPEPSLRGRWGKWIAAGVFLIVAGIWWGRHGSAPPVPPAPQASVPTAPATAPASPAQALPIETAALPAQKDAPATAPLVPAPATTPLVPAPAAEALASPLAGEWSCEDALTGHVSRYTFQQNGTLTMATSNGQLLDFKYELEGTALKVIDSTAARVFSVEELAARKMILNLGGAGQRVVCKR